MRGSLLNTAHEPTFAPRRSRRRYSLTPGQESRDRNKQFPDMLGTPLEDRSLLGGRASGGPSDHAMRGLFPDAVVMRPFGQPPGGFDRTNNGLEPAPRDRCAGDLNAANPRRGAT